MCRWHWINVSQILSIQSYYVTSRSKSQMREIERYGDIINDYKKWRDTTVCAINKFGFNVWYRPLLTLHIRLQWRNFYSCSLHSIEQIILYLNTFFRILWQQNAHISHEKFLLPMFLWTYISKHIYVANKFKKFSPQNIRHGTYCLDWTWQYDFSQLEYLQEMVRFFIDIFCYILERCT